MLNLAPLDAAWCDSSRAINAHRAIQESANDGNVLLGVERGWRGSVARLPQHPQPAARRLHAIPTLRRRTPRVSDEAITPAGVTALTQLT